MLKATRQKLMQNQPKFLLRIDDNHQFAGMYDRKSALNHLKLELDVYQKFTGTLTAKRLYSYFKERFTLTAVSHVYCKDNLIYYEPLTVPINYPAWFNLAMNTDCDIRHHQTLPMPTYDLDRNVRYHYCQSQTSHAGYRYHHSAYSKHKGHFAAYCRYQEAANDIDQNLPFRHRYRKTKATFADYDFDEYGSRRSYGWKTSTHRKHQYKNSR